MIVPIPNKDKKNHELQMCLVVCPTAIHAMNNAIKYVRSAPETYLFIYVQDYTSYPQALSTRNEENRVGVILIDGVDLDQLRSCGEEFFSEV